MWIEVHDTLPEHRKTERLAQALGVDQAWAAGILVCLWTWALRNAPDGDLTDVSEKALSRACFWEKKSRPLGRALRDCGWIDPDNRLHHWDDYAGRLMEKRAANARRMRAARARAASEPEAPACAATQPDPTEPDTTSPDITRPDALTRGEFPDDAWKVSARARGAVAQRVVNRLVKQGCRGANLYDVVCEYLEVGLPPERMLGMRDLDETALSSALFERCKETGVRIEKEELTWAEKTI